jgi:toxin secretion/phage lysis holin
MHDFYKWLFSALSGAVAAFFGQYGLFIALVALAVVLDVITGIVKAMATGEGLNAAKARKGFWRKIALFVALIFGIFLDFAASTVLLHTGVALGSQTDMPFALIVCAYIIINEAISIAENLYLTNPDSFPPQIGKWLKVAKKEIEQKGNKGDGRTEKGDGRTEQ